MKDLQQRWSSSDWIRVFGRVRRVLLRGFQRFEESENRHSAAVLTLTTLFGAVPFLTVLSFALSWVPEMQGLASKVQTQLFDHFAPSTVSQLEDYFDGFAQQTQKLTLIGFLFLMVTALVALKNIEQAFNKVWRIPRGRTGVSGFLLYWAILSLGPLLVGAGFFITSYLASMPFVQSASQWTLGKALLSWLPWLLSALAFTLLYVAVPNCKVPFTKGLIGGVLVAALFEWAKALFTEFVTSFPSYRLVYGAFAILPLFILWVYVSWCLILLGMEWVYQMTRPDYQDSTATRVESLQGLRVLAKLMDAQKHLNAQKHHPWVNVSKAMQGLNTLQSEALLNGLVAKGWIARSDQDQLALIRDPNTLSLAEVLFEGPWPRPQSAAWQGETAVFAWETQLQALLEAQETAERVQFRTSLAQFFSEAPVNETVDNKTSALSKEKPSPEPPKA
jgi:membrane protein